MPPLTDRRSWTEPGSIEAAVADVEAKATPVAGPDDLDALVERLADKRVVMLGEATHGTSEFYRWRARLTARLIREHGFDFVAVEGDWTSCYELNRFVRDLPESPTTARGAVESFERWPTWMWANWETVEFLTWLELHNREGEGETGFYGLDVYGLFESMRAVVDYLETANPEAAEHAKDAYRCFEPYGEDAGEYASALRMVPESCEDEVVDVLTELRESVPEYDSEHDDDDYFAAEQNALVARNGEAYYRALASGSTDSWNVRDEHMADTLDRLLEHHGAGSKAVVWAHNTHVGDARATDMERKGRLNIGQLARERHERVALVGFGTHAGRVIAGEEWGAPMEEMRVPPGANGSYEDVFHRAGGENRLLFSDDLSPGDALAEPRGHRAVGVVYNPAFESGNYVPTDLRERYDAYVHIEDTEALHPLVLHPDRGAVPELYPTGF